MKKRTLGGLGKNEPKRTQTNPISEKPKMNVNASLRRNYDNNLVLPLRQNKPNSNPNKPNFRKAIRTALFHTQNVKKKEVTDFALELE